MGNKSTAFAGLKVLDLSQGVAGPHCAWLLAQHGADVVKIEPPGGDWIRGLGLQKNGQGAYAHCYNAGKRSLGLDLKSPAALAVVHALVKQSDVVLESSRPGVADRLGIGYKELSVLNPKLIYLSVSGFGQTGPWSDRPCTDTVAQAFSGLIGINLGTNGVPHKLDTTIIDAITGLYAYQSVSTALYARRDSDEGAYLDVSLMGSAAAIQAPKIVEYQMAGGPAPLLNSPAGSYLAADGWMAITLVREAHFLALCEALEHPQWAAEPRFSDFQSRGTHHAELVALIQSVVETRSRDEWMAVFSARKVLAHPIFDYGDWMAHPQVTQTATAGEIPDSGGIVMPAAPGLKSDFGPTPRLGEHNVAVLRELGMNSEEIDALVETGAILKDTRDAT